MKTGECSVSAPTNADPSGAWGVAVLEVADETRAQELVAADPVVVDGQGFSYDVLTMPAGATR